MGKEMSEDEEILIKAESTWLNPAIKTKEELINWVLVNLGWPTITVELEENQLNVCIQNALEKYTKYASFGVDKFLLVNLAHYIPGKGLDLKKFNISSVKDISFQRDNAFLMNGDLFWGPYAFLGQGGGYPFFNSNGTNFTGSWVTWHAVNEFFELSKRMTGSNPDFQYHKETKLLQLMPEPSAGKTQVALLTCQVEPPLKELYGNEYVKRLTLAYAKILLGTVRKKFSGTQLIGGGQIDTTIGDEGRDELNKIMEDIIKDESIGQTWVIA
jgi:hypothetical protein